MELLKIIPIIIWMGILLASGRYFGPLVFFVMIASNLCLIFYFLIEENDTVDTMKECLYGKLPDVQKDCENYEPRDAKKNEWKCIKFRDLDGLHHCNGLGDRAKTKGD